ncbi:MAG: hypothetical protein JWO94_1468 [Verrucomicrobiaceae bacterium]|nr:hypothetical protein [Verrucomicrobiaceae bacterium]
MKISALLLLVILALLAFTNPNESQYRAHIQERQGVFGVLGLGLADLLSKDSGKGIHRENYVVFRKFYAGGDGILPRQDLAWGVAGSFIDIDLEKKK